MPVHSSVRNLFFKDFPDSDWNPSSSHWNSSLWRKDAAGYTADRKLETRVSGQALNKTGVCKAGSRTNVSRGSLSWRSSKQSTLRTGVCALFAKKALPFRMQILIKPQGLQEGQTQEVLCWKFSSVFISMCSLNSMCAKSSCLFVTLWTDPAELLCPWHFPSKNTRVGCRAILQGIFPTQGSKLHLLHCWRILYHWATREASS